MVNVVETSVKAVKGTLGALAQEADKLLEHKHVRAAGRANSSMSHALGMVEHKSEAPNEIIL